MKIILVTGKLSERCGKFGSFCEKMKIILVWIPISSNEEAHILANEARMQLVQDQE
jgi:2'-5' RNA ligase